MFCSGANIFMLGLSSHAWKVNFCKFTNETRNGIEDSSRHSGLKFIAAVQRRLRGRRLRAGARLRRDRAGRRSLVARCRLPEVPLLGVLPGTGGLTRLTDKRKVRRDLADIFCTTTEGVRGAAREGMAARRRRRQAAAVRRASASARSRSLRKAIGPADARGVALTPLERTIDDAAIDYEYVDVAIDRAARRATLTVRAPRRTAAVRHRRRSSPRARRGGRCAMARELDDAILMLRTNELEIGTWLLKHRGRRRCRARGATPRSTSTRTHWFVRETIGMLRRTLARLDVSSRTLFALIEPRLVLRRHAARARARRRPQLHAGAARRADARRASRCRALNFGAYPMVERPVAARSAVLRRAGTARRAARSDRQAARRRRGAARSASSPRARRARLGRRDAHRDRGAREPVARRADRHGGEPALRRRRDDGDARSSGGCPRGRTGSSSARTPSARRAR